MKKIKVTLNYNANKEIILKVPEDWNKAQIDKVLTKKYGIYDIKHWIILEEEVTA